MATTYVTMANLTRYDSNLKTYIDSEKTKAIKSVMVKDNAINFYVSATPDEATVADFKVDMPVEYFLDQAKTQFVQSFTWSEELYPGSTDPDLPNMPVLVLAVKGDDGSVSYSFLDVTGLMNIYSLDGTDSITISKNPQDENQMSFAVAISEIEGNILSVKNDGLYASVTEVDISTKADKLVNPETGDAVIKASQILVDDGNGNLAASGKTIADVIAEANAEFVQMTDDEIDALFA